MGINQDLTATGTSPETLARSGAFAITGTFVATVELQRRVRDIWQPIASYDVPTVETDDISFENGVIVPMRFEVTAFTSGTVTVLLVK